MTLQQATAPLLKDLTVDNITDNVKMINSQGDKPRMKFLFERLVQHLHDYARETRLSTEEWEAAIHFLTKTGQICSDVRQVSMIPCSRKLLRAKMRRNLYSCLTSWVYLSWSTALITRSHPTLLRALCWALSTRMKPSTNLTGTPSRTIQTGSHV